MTKLKQKIIVTGATGFVGKRLVVKLIQNFPKENILCLVRNTNTPFENEGRKKLKKLKIAFKEVDLVSGAGLKKLPKNPELIIHLAANTDTSSSDHRVNDEGVRNLYNSIGPLNKRAHFIHIGTMINVAGRTNCKNPIDEESRDLPTNEYTRTKLRGEQFLVEKCIEDKFALTVLRPNTIYGKGVRKNSLFDMVKSFILKDSIVTKINWPGKSAYIHVDDVVKAVIFFSRKKAISGKPDKYLLYAENLSIADVSKILHKEMKIKYNPLKLPEFFWNIIKKFRIFIPYTESILGAPLYNNFWRFGLIIDDVVRCKTDKINKVYKSWHPKILKDTVGDVI